ncbi:MAG: methyltransferase domain-containing protein [Phycisphaerales bacterium]|nr:MAG: methyltransferase domain-containing protein [Phycisphaerales bacterium]
MNADCTDSTHNDDAPYYDKQVAEHGCHGHEVLFGLMYEYVKPGETLLDIGIGTGLASFLFHKAGLRISGFDSSREMLAVCESKGFAAQLIQHDLLCVPYPYAVDSFNHVISLGVLNFFADLAPVFEETARIIRPQGIFAFSVEEQKQAQPAEYVFRVGGDPGESNGEIAVSMHRHSDGHIRELLARHGFTPLKDYEFLADRYPSEGIDVYFNAYVAQRVQNT